MRKNIIGGLIASIFVTIVVFLALDNSEVTYAISADNYKSSISLTYECGNKDCTGLPSIIYLSKLSDNYITIDISSIEPTSMNSNYVFWYWTNKSETVKYKDDCSGLSNCMTSISMTQNTSLHAKWRMDTAAEEEFVDISDNNDNFCKSILLVMGLFVLITLGFLTYSFLRGKKENI